MTLKYIKLVTALFSHKPKPKPFEFVEQTFIEPLSPYQEEYKLGMYDKVQDINRYVSKVFVYENKDAKKDFMNAEKMKHSLQLTLEHFPFLGQTIKDDPVTGRYLENTNRGIYFEEMKSNTNFTQFKKNKFVVSDLRQFNAIPSYLYGTPLIIKQVRFPDSDSTILVFNSNHFMMDGKAMDVFLDHWSKIARGLPTPKVNLVSPVDNHLLDKNIKPEYDFESALLDPSTPSSTVDFYIDQSKIDQLKKEAALFIEKEKPEEIKFLSTDDLINALAYKHLTFARKGSLPPISREPFIKGAMCSLCSTNSTNQPRIGTTL